MNIEEVVRCGSVFQTDLKVTIVEPGRRVITFVKNSRDYSIEPLSSDDSEDLTSEKYQSGDFGQWQCSCFGILGMVCFTEGPYLIVITDVERYGCIMGQHDVYTIRGKELVPLYYPCPNTDIENYYCSLFNQFDVLNNFYFSYTYNLANSLQANYSYKQCVKDDSGWIPLDAGVVTQKFKYNFVHSRKLSEYFGTRAEGFCLRVIHGHFAHTTVNLSGRSLTIHLIARRSRFYAGTRYRKRGITASGHVANDVETEQILEDVTCTDSIYSFVQVRGSTPTFWAQDTTKTIVKKPPLTYPQNDPAYTAPRKHVAELFTSYGVPLIMLNLLSDDTMTDEGQLSERYDCIVKSINAELPSTLQIQYIHRNIRGALERGDIHHMVTQLIEHSAKELGYFHLRHGTILSVQTGVLRTSCLDCLDRTSVVTMQLGLFIFQKQLEMLGIQVQNREVQEECNITSFTESTPINNEEFGFNRTLEPLLELFKNMFESMGDALAMQYAGSRALRKYEGTSNALSRSLQLLTTLKRRYSSHFTDADRQTLSNVFMGVLKPDRHPPPWTIDVDKYISCERFKCEYANLEWWVIPLMCFLKRLLKLEADVTRPWFNLFDKSGEYRLWLTMAKLLAEHRSNHCYGEFRNDHVNTAEDEEEGHAIATVLSPAFSILSPSAHSTRKKRLYTDYVEFERYRCYHITRVDNEGSSTMNSVRSVRDEERRALPPYIDTVDQTDRTCSPVLLNVRKPDKTQMLLSLEPWGIEGGDKSRVFGEVATIHCREVDFERYRRFVEPHG
ncbi:Polyphosphoinositide phosphatase [Babesia sp. Xinjiang]|uniref:Polyphosphoinositide phosphatase n=1 Tax=Babesia sp. Xinjiang TaxID=462227 RepID=UPI000A22184E|nr:Polyphosphoinositide phosphatase [Babesia sp. Xinjiang]ORM41986.1 Polyphosphoinositide phosphatase [Babesia sp. Xinjiang]